MSVSTPRLRASYRARLRNDLSAMIESEELSLSNLHKQYLRSRWLEQVLRMEQEVARATNRYHALRLITVVGCLFILVLVSIKIDDAKWATSIHYSTIALSLLVSISVAVEQVFQYGKRWWQAERIAERLKTEGWRFLQLSGRYRHYASHTEAFPIFANQIEDLSQREVEAYVVEIVREKEKEVSTREISPEVATSLPHIDLPLNLPSVEDEEPKKQHVAPQPVAQNGTQPVPQHVAQTVTQPVATPRDSLRDRVTRHLNQRQAR